jgi:glycosidase
LGNSLARTKLAAAVLLTSAGSPFVYYGEEMGYIGSKSNDDLYIRSPLYWGDDYTTNFTDRIDPALSTVVGTVKTQEADSTSMLQLYRKFARVRNTYPAMAYGTMTEHPLYNDKSSSAFPQIGAWYRISGSETLLVLHNFGQNQLTISIEDQIRNAVVSNGNVYVQEEKDYTRVKMDAYSSVVFDIK